MRSSRPQTAALPSPPVLATENGHGGPPDYVALGIVAHELGRDSARAGPEPFSGRFPTALPVWALEWELVSLCYIVFLKKKL